MRALVVMPVAVQRGGAELMLLQLLEHGASHGLESTVVFLEDGPLVAWCHDRGVRAVVLPAGKVRQVARFAATVRRLTGLARGEDPQIMVAWMGKGHLYSAPAALVSGTRRVWLQAGIPTRDGWMDRLATLLPADRIVTLSKAGDDAQRSLRPRRSTAMVYPATDLSKFDPGALGSPGDVRDRLGLPPDVPLYGTVGRLQRWKGFHVLIEALPEVLRTHSQARCVLVGGEHASEPEYPAQLRVLARELRVSDNVVFAGHQTNPEEWMQALDVFVHAANREPFGIVIIEALALGKPVVATNTAGPTEIISPGREGLLVPYGDAAAQADAVATLLSDAALRTSMGTAARARATDFSVDRYVSGFVRVLEEVVDGN